MPSYFVKILHGKFSKKKSKIKRETFSCEESKALCFQRLLKKLDVLMTWDQ